MDDLGNRTNVNLRNGSNQVYVVDETTNRYTTVAGNSLDYDSAGNMAEDQDGYDYQYDYENRLVNVCLDGNDVAEFSYDALGRRIEKYDAVADVVSRYYYSPNWQVLCEQDDNEDTQRCFVYGNYIDEVLVMFLPNGDEYYYAHDHLYSPAALIDDNGNIVERYEYNAYGERTIYDESFSNVRSTSAYTVSAAFTGQYLCVLDNGNLSIMDYKGRHYAAPLGRFLQHDPVGIIPEDSLEYLFDPIAQFDESVNLYEYVSSSPICYVDPMGEAKDRRRNDRNRQRRRGLFDDVKSDWAGRAILSRYLRGGPDWTINNNPRWTSYMIADTLLRSQMKSIMTREALRICKEGTIGKQDVDIKTKAEVENGEGIIGYNYLHGTNDKVGGFTIKGTATLINRCCHVQFYVTYTWNDIIDPNPNYITDTIKNAIAEAITLGKADAYKIHISWSLPSSYHREFGVNTSRGWPFRKNIGGAGGSW